MRAWVTSTSASAVSTSEAAAADRATSACLRTSTRRCSARVASCSCRSARTPARFASAMRRAFWRGTGSISAISSPAFTGWPRPTASRVIRPET